MLSSIKKYLAKVKEEVSKEYTIGSPESREKSLPTGWIGVDLDGTLAYDSPGASAFEIGDPVPAMLERVRVMLDRKMRVKIFTARASDTEQLAIIRKWLAKQGLPELEITNIKDYNMIRLYDDRCVQVETNTGRLITEK
jgi:hypothetical protein